MPGSMSPVEDAVVTVAKSVVGAHVGILYRVDKSGARRHLHLAFHHQLQDDPDFLAETFWIRPGLDEYAISDLCAAARLIANRHRDRRVAYALHPRNAAIDQDGTIRLNQSLGLTCATFVVLVFRHVRVELLNAESWDGRTDERRLEDEKAQTLLVSYLQARSAQHAEMVRRDIGCTRIRAEEVAAASGMTDHPIPFDKAEPAGRRVLEMLRCQSPKG